MEMTDKDHKDRNCQRIWVWSDTHKLWKHWARIQERQLSREMDRVIRAIYAQKGLDPKEVLTDQRIQDS